MTGSLGRATGAAGATVVALVTAMRSPDPVERFDAARILAALDPAEEVAT